MKFILRFVGALVVLASLATSSGVLAQSTATIDFNTACCGDPYTEDNFRFSGASGSFSVGPDNVGVLAPQGSWTVTVTHTTPGTTFNVTSLAAITFNQGTGNGTVTVTPPSGPAQSISISGQFGLRPLNLNAANFSNITSFTISGVSTDAEPFNRIGVDNIQISNIVLGSGTDTTPPTITVPGTQTREAVSPGGAGVTYSVTFADNIGVASSSCSPASGSTFAIGTTAVNCSASDAAGNTANRSFNVVVQDTTPPTIAVPGAPTVEATSASGATVTYSANATDAVGVTTTSCSPASGSTFAIGTTAVSCSASDAAGNTGNNSFNVVVQDTTPPAVTVPGTQTVPATSPTGAIVNFASLVSFTDTVGVTFSNCSPVSGSVFLVGISSVACTAEDAAGNTGNNSFDVVVQDTTPPTLTSFSRQTPTAATTNADSLVFRAVFSENVLNLDLSDFVVSGGTTAIVTNVSGSDSTYDVTVSGGDLADFNGAVGLDLAGGQNIEDAARNPLPPGEPGTDETYTLDNTGPVLLSITLPPGAEALTNANTLVLRLTFDGDAQNVDATDVIVTGGSTATVTGLTTVTPETVFDLEISAGNIATYAGTVGLGVAPGQDIADSFGNPFAGANPAISQTYQLVIVEAGDDTFRVAQGKMLTVEPGNGLLANDDALDVNALSIIAIDGQAVVGASYAPAAGGTLNVAADGTLTFDTGDTFNSLSPLEETTVSFTYTTGDGDTEATATATITVFGFQEYSAIPTLSWWAALVMMLLMAGAGVSQVRRRS